MINKNNIMKPSSFAKYDWYIHNGYRVLGFASRSLQDYSPESDLEKDLVPNGISVL